MKIIHYLIISGLGIALFGCSKDRELSAVAHDPAVIKYTSTYGEALNRIVELLKEGKLSGFRNDDHGTIVSQNLPAKAELDYPLHLIVQVKKKGQQEFNYWYSLMKETEAAKWEVIEAWKTDSNGQNREELLKVLK